MAVQKRTSKNVLLDTALKNFYAAAEEMNLDDNKAGKELFHRRGVAGFHAPKIGNALRTIDTWYPEFTENDEKPIPVEPNGASLDAQQFFRVGKEKVSGFDILKEIRTLDPNSEKGMFLIACLIRGGVYSEGE